MILPIYSAQTCSGDLKYKLKCADGKWQYDGGESQAYCGNTKFCQVGYSSIGTIISCEDGARPVGFDSRGWGCDPNGKL